MQMIGKLEFLLEYKLTPKGVFFTFGNNTNSTIRGYGILTNGNFTIHNVAYLTDLKHNLISVARLPNANQQVEFINKHNNIMTEDWSKCLIQPSQKKSMYPLNINVIIIKPQICFVVKVVPELVGYGIEDSNT